MKKQKIALFATLILASITVLIASIKTRTLKNSANKIVFADSGCVNGPNVTRYCFVNEGTYSCDDYWIWNCITEVNS